MSYHLPGQELAVLVGLFLWNLRLVRGFALHPPPNKTPVTRLRTQRADDMAPVNWPRDPVLKTLLSQLDWPTLLKGKQGFTWDDEYGEIHCDQGRILTFTTVRPDEYAPGRTGIIFRRPSGGCRDCHSRPDCLHSIQEDAPKHIELGNPTPIAEKLLHRLALIRGKLPLTTVITPVDETPGPRTVTTALFLPAAARQIFMGRFEGANLRVEVTLPPPPLPRPRLVATDVPHKQRRRKTWEQNRQRHELPEGATVTVEVTGSAELMAYMGLATEAGTRAQRRA